MREARYWHAGEAGRLLCDLCPHRCAISEGRTGRCRIRRAEGGKLNAVGYGLLSSANLDPIEKKPLYHFLPGSDIFSVGGWGCNFACTFCQNWTISQQLREEGSQHAPAEVVSAAARGRSAGIAYTYNEPLVNFEFVMDCAALARERGLANVLVTNGYLLPEPASELLPLVDALNVDVKSIQDSFYREHCGGSLQPVLDFAYRAVKTGCHVEVTNLVIPGLNDDPADVESLARWVAGKLGRHTALHLSAYRPMHKMTVKATPAETLAGAYSICRRHLDYVYIGNLLTPQGQDTECPKCGAVLVSRRGYATDVCGIKGDACSACGRAADLVTAPRRRSPPPAQDAGLQSRPL